MVVHWYIRGGKHKLNTQMIAAWRAGVVLMEAISWGCEAEALWFACLLRYGCVGFHSSSAFGLLTGQCSSDVFEN